MSRYHKLLIAASLLFSSATYAADVFLDALYWRATESVDWCYDNSLSTPVQTINYQTVNFDYKPGFRVGLGSSGKFDNALYYTRYYTSMNAAANGNLVTTFLGGKLALNGTFSNSGQVNFKIDFNMFDWDMSKSIHVSNAVMMRPIIGLRGGWINQTVITNFQGTKTFTENVKNNFRGIGPKIGLETDWIVKRAKNHRLSVMALFTTSYLWGKWDIRDTVTQASVITYETSVGRRNFGAFAVQGLLGVALDYKRWNFKLGYEIADWFEQYQILDDGTGARCVDLILQGLTVGIVYKF